MLGDFSNHAEAPKTSATQDFMAAMPPMVNLGEKQDINEKTSKNIYPNTQCGHTLGLVDGDLDVEEIDIILFLWTDHLLV